MNVKKLINPFWRWTYFLLCGVSFITFFWLKGALVIVSCIQKSFNSNQNKVVTKYFLIS